MGPVDKPSQTKFFPPIVSGLIYAFIVMLIGTFIISFLLFLNAAGESSLSKFSYITHIASLLIGGWVAGKKSGSRGWYYGAFLGCIYSLIIFMIAFLAFDADLNLRSMALLGTCLGTSSIGGIMGVNSKK